MMVTFVSQCEKNALKKTRRVLDAFANRIGDNTWQTVITEDGLLTVKKMLRQTASKSTAVSCHWIRSRARSQFLWVVGNKSKFNAEGVVPVNTTGKEVPMDIKQIKPVKGEVYANTQLQRLDQHLFAVGLVAQQLSLYFYPDKEKQAKAAFIAGCMHDIGKLDSEFQKWVVNPKSKSYNTEDGHHIDNTKFSFEKHPRHNEISALIFQCIADKAQAIRPIKPLIKHAIYWHHAKPFRPKAKDEFDTYGKIYHKLKASLGDKAWSLVFEDSITMLSKVSELDMAYRQCSESILKQSFSTEIDDECLINYEHTPLPCYKEYGLYEKLGEYETKVRVNANNNEVRACLITADRWVSSLSSSELSQHIQRKTLNEFVNEQLDNYVCIESDLTAHINECLGNFPDSDRSKKQSQVAQELAQDTDKVKVLAGAAGCGKTKIALEWAGLRNAQQIIWVCPRVQICQGMFSELKASDNPYLNDATVELFTGEFKCTDSFENLTPDESQLTGDIVITTIDQLLSNVISHTKADRLLNYLNAHVIFDEYHEYINMPAFNVLFAELITSRKELGKGCNALLVSATPNYFYLKEILYIDIEYDVVEMASFNDKKYQFDFVVYDETQEDQSNPLYQKQTLSTFVISNTATTAQKSFIQNLHDENAILLHSKFKKSDKKQLFNKVFDAFKRDGDRTFELLRSGPIVQASLNISCDYMVSEMTTAENCLQRMGRLDRFGVNNDINRYTIAIPEPLNTGKGSSALGRFLASTNELSSAKAWYALLVGATDNGQKVQTIKDVYALYKAFYKNASALVFIEQDMLAAMKKSVGVITAKVSEPQTMITRKKQELQRAKISSNSLRGDSRFVQMALCDLSNKDAPKFIEGYAYNISTDERNEVDNLTSSCDLIQGYGNSTDNLLTNMMKKHHNIMGEKKAFKDFILLNDAKDPEFPIYLSYSPNDLLPVGGETARHSSAIYYGVCEQQAIGAISIKNLKNNKD
ncbi:CRISPR-associated endonuclease Cas3'' [Pseudocolwellia sp. AS88]|uniref:CRISPR-associated endonuclease Cas3'' n=1 Tax=Pseudocolwellia sp. AS88 TaxID=3063958 RepID=UPI0026EBFE08|nr:CRISPR-associated endonuclease Cas3'' [Pseudocolwellia sp. AS88]MDO7086781.1 CRISPR-associated endonuclease Cas3'' [Pseudocolwellia sp. AS88]